MDSTAGRCVMAGISFPRKTTRVGGCIAVAAMKTSRGPEEGSPLLGKYRAVRQGGDLWPAHRLSYHLNVAPIPRSPGSKKEGLVLHICDNKWCINPEHLYLGSCSQNAKDRWDRNEEFRLNAKASYSAAAKRRWSRAEERKKQSERTSASMGAERRAEISEQTKLRWSGGWKGRWS